MSAGMLILKRQDALDAASDIFNENELHFEGIPENGLYWLREKDSDIEERIFIYCKHSQIWY